MGSDLISRKALLERLEKIYGTNSIVDKIMLRFLKKLIRKQPTVDAVEVVRCKDCQCGYFTRDGFYESIGCTVLNRKMRPTDYCVFGVKMDGGDKE